MHVNYLLRTFSKFLALAIAAAFAVGGTLFLEGAFDAGRLRFLESSTSSSESLISITLFYRKNLKGY
jgi:hypothetical protein